MFKAEVTPYADARTIAVPQFTLNAGDRTFVLGSEKAAWFRDPEGNILCVHQVIAQ